MTSATDCLFEPFTLGSLRLKNRIAMAPLTRQRSTLQGVPTALNLEYYRQRASAGLIVTEGTSPAPEGSGYLFIPGLYNDEQEASWKAIANAVHGAGGAIFVQIMHTGRLSDPLLLHGEQPRGPSAVQPNPIARHYGRNMPRPNRPYPEPRAMTHAEILATIDSYADSARRAKRAGLDGVEIHGASGYLPMQFLSTNTNLRDDQWGGSVEKRAAFLLACVDAMVAETGPDFVAVKVSPGWSFNDVSDDDSLATYSHVARELSRRGIAYLHYTDMNVGWDVGATLRSLFEGPMMVSSGLTRASAAQAVQECRVDLVGFGRGYIANPDLADRFRAGQQITRPQMQTFYTQGEEGYTDYPDFAHSPAEQLQSPDEPLGFA